MPVSYCRISSALRTTFLPKLGYRIAIVGGCGETLPDILVITKILY